MARRKPRPKKLQSINWSQLHREARERFGIESFRPGQREAIEAVLNGRDALVIMPTGTGKSLLYQLPSLLLPQTTVVVSPLIALMQDQQQKADDAEIGAATLNSTLTKSETRDAVEEIRAGEHTLVYVTPERLENPEYLDLLASGGVSLFVVDEAHCISQWGHDFRPAYLALREAIIRLGSPPVLALTATAPPEVSDDITKQLGMRNPVFINTGLERKNLFLEVVRTVNPEAKRQQLRKVLQDCPGVGIVYAATVRLANEIWKALKDEGINAGIYHGKCKTKERQETQQRFTNDEYRLIVATKAFGLGIDKSNIRFVVHYNFPDSLESYYQEAGRAGRDGEPARCALFYRLEDRRIQGYFLGGKYPRREHSLKVYRALQAMLAAQKDNTGSGKHGVKQTDLVLASGLPKRRVAVIVAQLLATGVMIRRGRNLVQAREFANNEEFDQFLYEHERLAQSDRERLRAMMGYAESMRCRTRYMEDYFNKAPGDDCELTTRAPEEILCGHCDNCVSARPRESSAPEVGSFCPVSFSPPPTLNPHRSDPDAAFLDIGEEVRHKKFGAGKVLEINGRNVTVSFPQGAKRVRQDFLCKAA